MNLPSTVKCLPLRIALYSVLAVFGVQLAIAAETDTPRVSPMAKSLEELPPIQVSSADRISLRFQGQNDMSGEYRISSDGTLSVPVIGRISVADKSFPQLEQMLSQRVTEVTGHPIYVTAEVIAYRPVFVMGFVSKPGAIEWSPGLTVLQAMALAGGIYRAPGQSLSSGDLGTVEATRSLLVGREQQKQLLASLARLKAERAGDAQVEIPSELVKLAGEEEAKKRIHAQQALLETRRSGLEKKKAALQESTILASRELGGLNDQGARVEEQLRMRRDLQDKITNLQKKGFVPKERELESEIKIAELEEKATNVAVARARVEGTTATLKQDSVTLETDREAALDAEIMKVEADLTKAGIEVNAAMQTYSKLAAEPAQVKGTSLPRMAIKYTIVRRDKSGEDRAVAQTSSYLRYGDVLLVSQEAEDASGQPKEATEGGEAGRTDEAQ
jgi:protein involved in polysaccharide export with SLBB domain